MNQTSEDLDRRLAEQRERSKLRSIELMEWLDERHQQEKRRRERYQRFKGLYWTAGIAAAVVFVLIWGGFGLMIGDLIGHQITGSGRPTNVVVTMAPATPPTSTGVRP